MKVVRLVTNNQFYNLNALSTYPAGTALVITNSASSTIFLVQSETQPTITAEAFPVYAGKSTLIASSDTPIWAMGSVGPIVIQTTDTLICPSEMLSPRVLVGLEALTTQSFIEANCKNGVQYELATYDTAFLVGANREFILITGSKPLLVKSRVFSFTGDEISTVVYKNPTYTGGTPVPYYNLSDINPTPGEAVLLGTPTVSNAGTQISPIYRLLGSLPQGGQAVSVTEAEGSVPDLERVLAPNTTYLFRTTNTGTVTSKFSSKNTWYEGHLSSVAF